MIQWETANGSRRVITTANDEGGPFESRLYVNSGETACHAHASHKTREGADRWARATLGLQAFETGGPS